MMRHHITLPGCTLEPMAAYLKAVAVFRLVSEQADPTARGYWRGREFCLDSKLDREALERFFLEQYCPTPIVAPWNKGGGFYEGKRRVGIDAILGCADSRFTDYQLTIREIFSWPDFGGEGMTLGQMLKLVQASADGKAGKGRDDLLKKIDKVRSAADDLETLLPLTTVQIKKITKSACFLAVKGLRTAAIGARSGSPKDEIVRLCRNSLPNSAVDWIDCAVVLRTSTSLEHPPITGTGGNEGNLEYTNSFMERVSSLLLTDTQCSPDLLRNALFANPTGALAWASVGQLDPGRAGGYNQGPGIENKDFRTNYWNFVLSMEGAVAWAGSATRRQGIGSRGAFCSPFTVHSRSIAYASASDKDDASGAAEVWMPVWERACRYEEFRALLREGRVEWSGKAVTKALEFAEAAVSLGTDRGITAFQRYSIVNRRGDSGNIALPAGRIEVQHRRGVELLEEVDRMMQGIDNFQSGFKRLKKEPPAHFLSLRRQIDTAIYGFALRGGVERLQDILLALGRMERYFAKRDLRLDPKLHSPLSGLNPHWLVEANDGSVEFRIAVALASIGAAGEVGPLRANLTPIDPSKPWIWTEGSGQTAWWGNTLSHRMASILKRRLMDAARLNCKSLPLHSPIRLHPEDVAVFLKPGAVNDSRIEDLLFACTLVDWRNSAAVAELQDAWQDTAPDSVIPREYALLKHLFDPSVKTKPEPSILTLLTANRTADACDVAIRRLRASGCTPIQATYASGGEGLRLAASLLIPIHSLGKLSGRVLHIQTQDER